MSCTNDLLDEPSIIRVS